MHENYKPRIDPAPKSKRGENLLMLIFGMVVMVLFVGAAAYLGVFGLFGLFGSGDDSVPVASAVPTSQPGVPVKPVEQAPRMDCVAVLGKGTPCRVRAGRPFVYESMTMQAGWRVFRSEYGNRFSVTGEVKNTGKYPHTMWVAFRFLNGDKEVGALLCYAESLKPGERGTINCVDNGKFAKYDRITVETAA